MAAICGDEQLTWPALVARMHRVANGLRASGLGRDDKVAVLMSNSTAMLEVMLGVVAAGAAVVPLSPLSPPDALAAMLRASHAKALFVGAETRALVEGQLERCPAVTEERRFEAGFASPAWRASESWMAAQSDREPGIEYRLHDSFSILYTSGTTGAPKGMEHTHLARLLYPLGPHRLRADRPHLGDADARLVRADHVEERFYRHRLCDRRRSRSPRSASRTGVLSAHSPSFACWSAGNSRRTRS